MSDFKIERSPQPPVSETEAPVKTEGLNSKLNNQAPLNEAKATLSDFSDAMKPGLSEHLFKQGVPAPSLKDVPFNPPTEMGTPQKASDWLLQHNKLVVTESGAPGSTGTLKQALGKADGAAGPPGPETAGRTIMSPPITGTFGSDGIHLNNPIDMLRGLFQGQKPPDPTPPPSSSPPT